MAAGTKHHGKNPPEGSKLRLALPSRRQKPELPHARAPVNFRL